MSLSKSQKKVLKKIDEAYTRMEKLSRLNGFPVTEDVAFGFQFPDFNNLVSKKVNDQNKKRKQVFEKSDHRREKAF